MELELRINAEFGADSFVVYDTTGTFDSGYNAGGYGTPNKFPQNATGAELQVTPPDETTPISITAIYPTLPNLTGAGYEVTATALGLDELVPGVWTISLTVTFSDGTESTVECKFANLCSVESCLTNREKQIDETCNTLYDDETFRLRMLIEGAKANMCAGQYDKANSLIQYVAEKCDCCC